MNSGRADAWPPAFLALLIVAAALRFGYVLAYPQIPLCADCAVLPDYVMYDEVGRNLADGKGFVGGFAARTYDPAAIVDPDVPEIGFGPVYPMLLGAVYAVAGHRVGAVRVVQAALSTLWLFPFFAIARWTFGASTALAAMAFAAVYPAFIVYSGMLLTETLSTTLMVTAIWAVLWAWRGGGAGRWALAGVVMGALILLRSEVLPLAAAVAALAVWRRPERQTVWRLALYAAVIAAMMTPWVVRNFRLYHRVIAVSAHAGDTLWISVKGWTEWHPDDPEFLALVRGRSYLEQQDAFHAAAVHEILSRPMEVAVTRLTRFPDFWLSGHTGYIVGLTESIADYRARGAFAAPVIKSALLALNTALIVAGLIGIARALTRPGTPPPGVLLLLAPIVCIAAVHVVMFAAPRYQVPIMPFLLMFAGALWLHSPPVGAE